MATFHDNAAGLAEAFIHALNAELSAEDIAACAAFVDANPDSDLCPTHDYCDSNQVMFNAFSDYMGREMVVLDVEGHSLSSAAWDLARRLGYSQHWYDTAEFCEWHEGGIEVAELGSAALVCGQHARESGCAGLPGIAYGDGSFVVQDGDGTFTAPLGNTMVNGTLETCELYLWLFNARHNQ